MMLNLTNILAEASEAVAVTAAAPLTPPPPPPPPHVPPPLPWAGTW